MTCRPLNQVYADPYGNIGSDLLPTWTAKRLSAFETRPLSYYGPNQPPPIPPPLTAAEEKAAFIRYRKRKTRRDRELLVRQYLIWAFGLAKKFRGPRLNFDEAISVANCGLMEALNNFNPHKGFRFTTYATFTVRRHLIEAIVNTYPVHVSDHLRKKWRLNESLDKSCETMAETGEPKTLEDFFERLGEASEVDVALLHERPEDSPFVPAPGISPADALESSSLPDEVKKAIRRLAPFERATILARHYKEPPESFEAIGQRLKISKNSARDSYNLALVKLRRFFRKEQ
jgi:RNA polymerase sigma factor (sigma-70 family)